MNKLCLLPISLILLNSGFAADADPKLMDELKSEIATLVSYDESDGITAFSELDEEMYFEEEPFSESLSDSSTAKADDENYGYSSSLEDELSYSSDNEYETQEYQKPANRSAPRIQLEAPKPSNRTQQQVSKPARSYSAPAAKAQRAPVKNYSQATKPARSYSAEAEAPNLENAPVRRQGTQSKQSTIQRSHGRPSVKKSPRAQIRAGRKQITQGEYQRTAVKKKMVVQNDDTDDQMNNDNMNNNVQDQDQGQMQMQQQNTMMPPPQKKKMVNTAARPFIKNGYDFWLFGEALIWQAAEENLPYATQVKPSEDRRKLETMDFNWDWGFRIGLGGNTSRDGWDIDLYWTRIRNQTNNHAHGTSSKEIQEFWTTAASAEPLGTFTKASAHGHTLLNQIDLELGREFYVGKFLTTRPFFGLRYSWIHQKYHAKYTGSVDEFAKLRSRFWGFGFAAGLDTNWWLGNGFSIYGDSDISVVFGKFNVHEKGTLDDSTIWTASNKTNAGRPIFDIGIGFQYRDTFCDESFALTARAGYEYHLYFNQNMFIQVNNGSSTFENFNPLGGNLGYQGASFSLQFDF